MRSWLKASQEGLSELHPTLPKRLLAATCILATYNKVACEQQTHFRSIFRRERSDDRKCVCCSQANQKVTPKTKNRLSAENSLKNVTPKTKNRLSAENSLKNEFPVYLHRDIDCMGEFRKVLWCKRLLYSLRFGSLNMLCTRNPLVLGGCLIHY